MVILFPCHLINLPVILQNISTTELLWWASQQLKQWKLDGIQSATKHWYYLGVWKYSLWEQHGQMLLPQPSLEGVWCYEKLNTLSASFKSEIKNALYLPHKARTYHLNYSAAEVGPVSHTHSSLRCSMGCRCKLPPASEAAPVFSHMRIASSNVEGCRVQV